MSECDSEALTHRTKDGLRFITKENGEQFATTTGDTGRLQLYAECSITLLQFTLLDMLILDKETVLSPFGWTVWSVEVTRKPLLPVGTMDGELMIARIPKMLELYATMDLFHQLKVVTKFIVEAIQFFL